MKPRPGRPQLRVTSELDKETDVDSASRYTVGRLPTHRMREYPYEATYNTRVVAGEIAPIETAAP